MCVSVCLSVCHVERMNGILAPWNVWVGKDLRHNLLPQLPQDLTQVMSVSPALCDDSHDPGESCTFASGKWSLAFSYPPPSDGYATIWCRQW